jgi:hypothetical protein
VARASISAGHNVKIGKVDLVHVERYECESAYEGADRWGSLGSRPGTVDVAFDSHCNPQDKSRLTEV